MLRLLLRLLGRRPALSASANGPATAVTFYARGSSVLVLREDM